jgi:protoporphyrinogen oxidase
MRNVILGAGMAGLATAIFLQPEETLLVEAEREPGGLCRSQIVEGCHFDFGPKILLLDKSPDKNEILGYLKGNYENYPVIERVFHSAYGLLSFPLQRHLIDLPEYVRAEFIKDIEFAQKNPKEVKSFKDWLWNSYGDSLCNTILYPYEEKKWLLPLDEMDYLWALDRPVRVDLEEVRRGATEQLPSNRTYYYPKTGNISQLTKAMFDKAGESLMGARVDFIDTTKKQVTIAGTPLNYERLISSMPLNTFVMNSDLPQELKDMTKQYLKNLSIVVFNLVFEGDTELEGSAIYFPEKEFIFRRVTIVGNTCPSLKIAGKTSVSVEVSVDPQQYDEKDVLAQVMQGLHRIPQFQQLGELIGKGTIFIDFAYPLQVNGLREAVKEIHNWCAGHDIYHVGRGGMFDYCNSDTAYTQGKEMGNKLKQKGK